MLNILAEAVKANWIWIFGVLLGLMFGVILGLMIGVILEDKWHKGGK